MAESLTSSVADTANRMRTLETEASEDQGLAKEVLFYRLQLKRINLTKKYSNF